MPFIAKDLSKAIMKKSRLRNKFLSNETWKNWLICKSKELKHLTFEKD